MPLSAISTGLADYVLKPSDMPAQLISYVTHAFEKVYNVTLKAEDSMQKLFNLLISQTGHDFSHYKHSTINRRVERRMAVLNIESLEDYLRYVEQKPSEVEALFFDLLIGVTSFFRNPRAFEVLEENVIPLILASKKAESVVRIWVPGCSTGEEAYSIGILFKEQITELYQNFRIQIFATDIDSRAILQARKGIYPSSISTDISSERLERFFIKDLAGNYQVQKSIRDLIVFSEQDVIKDPPFSKLDLISCRNVLIYMDKELQRKLIPLFHYALNPREFLFLGPSETIGEFDNLFDTFDRKSKIYQAKENARAEHVYSGSFIPPRIGHMGIHKSSAKLPDDKVQLQRMTERTLIENYAPASVLVNEYGDILYLHGRTGMYLEPAPGEARLNVLKMARERLQKDLIEDLHNAVIYKKPVFHPGLRVKTNGDIIPVNLAIRPIRVEPGTPGEQKLFLITFERSLEMEQSQEAKKTEVGNTNECAAAAPGEITAQVLALKKELRSREEYIRASKEELETSYEELQSTNEELETSKEELQSLNEELATVNAELQNKVTELSRANNDMNNLLSGTGIGTIFVNHQLRIMRFTPAVTQVINLIPTDVGRPVGHIVSNLVGYNRLVEDIKEVLDILVPKDIEVQTHAGSWYLMRIRPYRTLENVIEGVVITFTDITEMKKAREILKESESMQRLAVVVHDSSDAVTLQDTEGSILAWNPMAEKLYGWSEAEALQMNIRSLVPKNRKEEELNVLKNLSNSEFLKPYYTQRLTKDGRIIDVSIIVTPLINKEGKIYAIATTERKITQKMGQNSPPDKSK